MTSWTASDIPSQRGRTAVVTGTGGLGFEDALALARADAHVILAGRSPSKGAAAVERIRQSVPGATVRFAALDLASLDSIEAFGERLHSSIDSLDLLINNAGVMTPPERQVTAPQAQGGAYYGPDKLGETRGYPTVANVPPQALDIGMAERLWSESERLTGVTFF